jgi:hypothetical protein
MICFQCGSDVAESATACANCGTQMPVSAALGAGSRGSAAGVTAPASTVSRAQAFSFDAGRWTRTDRIAGAATLVLFISLFLPWFSVSAGFGNFSASSSADGLSAHGYLFLVLILALAMVAYLVARAGLRDMPALPLTHDQLLAAGAAVNLLLVLIAVVFKPASGSSLVKVGWDFGAFVAVIAALVAFAPLARSALRTRSGRG